MKLIDKLKVKKIEKRVNNIGDLFLYLYDVNSNLFKKIFLIGLFYMEKHPIKYVAC